MMFNQLQKYTDDTKTELKNFLIRLELNIDNELLDAVYERVIIKENNSIDDILSNPYILIEFYQFNILDEAIVKNSYLPLDNINRLVHGINNCVDKLFFQTGSTLFSHTAVLDEALRTLKLKDDEIIRERLIVAIDVLKKVGLFVSLNGMLSTKKMYDFEKFIYNTIKGNSERTKGKIKSDAELSLFILAEENRVGFKFSEKQISIIYLGNEQYNIFVLNGYAGAGKTTSAQSVLKLYEGKYGRDKIICCALSGVAASRAKSVTGFNGMTVHSLLGYDGEKFAKGEENKLDYAVIMLDEAGMVGSELMYSLLSSIDFSKTTLLIAGDSAQLQSIDAGDVYNNILTKKICKIVTLDKVYRQKEEQIINVVAQSIRQAILPNNYQKAYEDFNFQSATGENVIQEIKKIASQYTVPLNELLKNNKFKEYISAFQVIAPMRKKEFGIYNLNNLLQAIFNSNLSKDYVLVQTQDQYTKVHIKDKVIHQKNQKMRTISTTLYEYNKRHNIKIEEFDETKVFNGQIGIVVDIEPDFDNRRGAVFVYYPENDYIVIYSFYDIRKSILLDLAYAITVHKSQGSQYKTVVMPMVSQYYRMLNNKLVYTAITRAQSMLYIVGEQSAFKRGATNKEEIRRDTVLACL